MPTIKYTGIYFYMRFRLNRQHGALNSGPVFDAFEEGIKKLGHTSVTTDPEIEVIWSVLWHGRMIGNKNIYDRAKKQKLPVLIIEVGNLLRGKSWRISLDHIHGLGKFGNERDLNPMRPKFLGIQLSPFKETRRKEILIACQHQKSLQWAGQPPMTQWLDQKITEIRRFTDRPIIVRPHPRSPLQGIIRGVKVEIPKKLDNTYDDFDLLYNFHCVINHNSGVPVSAAIAGCPVITDSSSLAYPVSDIIENINTPVLKDREDWFLRLCHTEWTVEELRQGIPIKRLQSEIEKHNQS